MQDHQNPESRKISQWNGWPRANIVLVAFLGIAGFYLITEHRAACVRLFAIPAAARLPISSHVHARWT